MNPSWRKPVGMLIILTLITVWAIIVASLSPWIGQAHWSVQAIAYTILGIVWILPLKPLLLWMDQGKWRE
jgi:Protein of unknown function (DUF2842)